MVWSEGQTLAARWQEARHAAATGHPHWKLGSSYGGFATALARSDEGLIEALKQRFRQQMVAAAGEYRRRFRWEALAADGSRLEAPHVAANEAGLGCAGRDKTGPQVFLTTLWHLGTGLPWDFRVGPGTDSERTHLRSMLPSLPEGTLLVADAGFASYRLCREICDSKRFFLFRVGSNLRLLTELGFHHEEREGLVYLWPHARRQEPPLVLRLIRLTPGKQTVYLLTNVMAAEALTEEEAGLLYQMRWGIEVFYRSCKQTLNRRRLLSRTPATCLAEARWMVLGVWLLGLMSVQALVQQGRDPLRLSFARARDAVRRAMRGAAVPPRRRGSGRPERGFRQELRTALRDEYRRKSSKTARNYPRKKREKPPGPPEIKPATATERQRAQQLRTRTSPIQRTA
jgi:hypothetical protein